MHFDSTHVAEARPTGLPGVPDIPWGTHLCQFYRSREELMETLVPFFKAGLDCGERCIGVVAEPLRVEEVLDALRAAIPDLESRLAAGDLELADPEARYADAHAGSPGGTVGAWAADEAAALARGYAGLRILGNVPTARAAQWNSVMAYEAEMRREFDARRIVAICGYPLDACDEDQIVDVLGQHAAALVQREGRMELVRSATVLLESTLGDGDSMRDSATPHGQLVRFFTDHAYPADSIADFLCRGLARGARAYALATPDHLTRLRDALQEHGIDVDGAAREQLTLRDASVLAEEVLAGEAPTTVLDRRVAPELGPLLARGEQLCVYDELVEQLCRANLVSAALDAERWWNRTRSRGVVEILCGYSFEGFARSHALSLDRAGAYDAADRARANLQRLADATRRISEARLDVGDVVRTVVREVTDSGLSRACAIHLLSEDGRRLAFAGVHHVDPALSERVADFARRLPVTPDTRILGMVAVHGRAVRFADAESLLAQEAPEYRDELVTLGVRSMMSVPLRATGEVLGVITVARGTERVPFDEDDERWLQELADRAALSLQNAQLYENAQRQRERAERECARAELERERATEASRAKDEFLAMLGHELRNPLSPMLTAIQLMRLRAEHVFEKERTIIERQVHHMVRLIDDLLDVSRITRGKVKLTLQPTELARVVASAIETATPLLENGTHHLAIDVPRGFVVMADLDRLAQVIVNLLTNAARYTPEGGTITIGAAAVADKVELAVRDTGVGIDPALLPHIFDLFVQGKQASHRPHGGLGLGLAISKSLVAMHAGTLRAESAGVGTGAVFTIELPRVDPAAVQPVNKPAELAPSAANGHRVLVVDDNVDGCETLATALSTVGYEVRCAYDGPSALTIAAEFQPRLALLDLGLPGMDGYELAQRLAELPGLTAPQMIAISGYGQPADRARSLQVGFREHLVKPVDFHGLQKIAAKLLEG